MPSGGCHGLALPPPPRRLCLHLGNCPQLGPSSVRVRRCGAFSKLARVIGLLVSSKRSGTPNLVLHFETLQCAQATYDKMLKEIPKVRTAWSLCSEPGLQRSTLNPKPSLCLEGEADHPLRGLRATEGQLVQLGSACC